MSMSIATNISYLTKNQSAKLEKEIKKINFPLLSVRHIYGKQVPAFLYNPVLFKGMDMEECIRLVLKLPTFKRVSLTVELLGKYYEDEKSKELIGLIKGLEKYRVRFLLKGVGDWSSLLE